MIFDIMLAYALLVVFFISIPFLIRIGNKYEGDLPREWTKSETAVLYVSLGSFVLSIGYLTMVYLSIVFKDVVGLIA